MTPVVEPEHRALPAVAWLASSGVAFDRDGWRALAAGAEAEAARLAGALTVVTVGFPADLPSEIPDAAFTLARRERE